jgi:hypothetical protein
MYKELENLFPDIKLPVKIDEQATKIHLEQQLKNNEKLYKQVELFLKVFKSYPNYGKYSEDKNKIVKEVGRFITSLNLFKSYALDKEGEYNKSNIIRQSKIVDFYVRHEKEFSNQKNIKNNEKVNLSEKYLFIQFDMIEGNFNVLKQYYNLFLNNENSNEFNDNDKIYYRSMNFNELLDSIFENNNSINKDLLNVIKSSKSIRQVIYGNLSLDEKNSGNIPKKNDKMMAYVLNKVEESIKEDIKDYEIVGQSQDEIIIAIPKEKLTQEFLTTVRKKINTLPVRSKLIGYSIVPEIKTKSKDEPKKFYIEEEIDEDQFLKNNEIKVVKQKLKSVPKNNYIPMFVKYILNENLKSSDLLIENEGNIYQMILE